MANNKNNSTKELTIEQIEQKAQELTASLNCKVHPLVFVDDESGEKIVGYMKEPARIVKMRALDKVLTSQSTAGAELLEACLIKEHSDHRIYSEAAEHDNIYLGACLAALSMVKMLQNTYSKKK